MTSRGGFQTRPYRDLIKNHGPEIVSPLQIGHFPGLFSLSLLVNKKPHFLHSAGLTTKAFPLLCIVF